LPKYRWVLKVKYRLVLKVKYRLVLKVKYRLVLKVSVKQGCTVYWIRDLLVCMISRTSSSHYIHSVTGMLLYPHPLLYGQVCFISKSLVGVLRWYHTLQGDNSLKSVERFNHMMFVCRFQASR
jgi:hypothetical protein